MHCCGENGKVAHTSKWLLGASLLQLSLCLPVVPELHRHAVAPKKTGDRARRGGPDGQRFDDIILIHLPALLLHLTVMMRDAAS